MGLGLGLGCCCKMCTNCPASATFKVVVSGVVNNSATCPSANCDAINGTYILTCPTGAPGCWFIAYELPEILCSGLYVSVAA